jgi:hypothetical protein
VNSRNAPPTDAVVVVVVEVVVVVVLVVVELVVVVVVVSQGFGVQDTATTILPPLPAHAVVISMVHWSKGPPGVLCLQHAKGGAVDVGVVVVVVVVVVPQMPNFPPWSLPPVHTLLQQLELVRHDWPSGMQGPALATPHPTTMWAAVRIVTSNRTRRVSDFFMTASCVWAPAPGATAANNVTTAFLVIVEPPVAVPMQGSFFGALSSRATLRHACQRGICPSPLPPVCATASLVMRLDRDPVRRGLSVSRPGTIGAVLLGVTALPLHGEASDSGGPTLRGTTLLWYNRRVGAR